MAIEAGLDCATFWRMTPKTLEWYMEGRNKLAEQKNKDDANIIDYTAWLQGAYFTNAIAACFDKRAKYPSKPSTYEEPEKSATEMAADFAAFAKQFNANFNAGR